MYELEEHYPEVAAQIDALPLEAWIDYEAATAFILQRPLEGEPYNVDVSGGSCLRPFGLGMGLILYSIARDGRRVRYQQVSYLAF